MVPLALLAVFVAACAGQGGVRTVAAPSTVATAPATSPDRTATTSTSPEPAPSSPFDTASATATDVNATAAPTTTVSVQATRTTAPAVTATATATTTTAAPSPPSTRLLTLAYGGLERSYLLHVPPGATSRPRMPLVVALHGLHSRPSPFATTTGLSDLADRAGFVVVYPTGWATSWDAGTCCGDASQSQVDDVGFVLAVRSAVIAEAPVDPARVFLTGFSNGGMMTYRLACDTSGVFRAVAIVAGTIETSCTGSSRVPLLHIHGLADRTVPFNGSSYSSYLHTPLRPVEDSVDYWRTRDGSAAAVQLVTLPGVPHVWPTSSNAGYSATSAIWSFFSSYTR